MGKKIIGIVTIMLFFGLIFSGCGKVVEKAESSRAAVAVAKQMKDKATGKVDYLLKQAQAFYDAKDYRGAVDISQYILWHLDRNSKDAQDMLSKAKGLLAEQIKAKQEALNAKRKAAREAREKRMAEEAAKKAKVKAQKTAEETVKPVSETAK